MQSIIFNCIVNLQTHMTLASQAIDEETKFQESVIKKFWQSRIRM
jgi:hypothetical protein